MENSKQIIGTEKQIAYGASLKNQWLPQLRDEVSKWSKACETKDSQKHDKYIAKLSAATKALNWIKEEKNYPLIIDVLNRACSAKEVCEIVNL